MAKYRGSKLADGTPLNVAVYKAYRNAGLSHNQALAITAEVGRENGFNAGTLFGSHTDPAANSRGGAIRNVGMLSWNQGRDSEVLAYLKSQGQLVNGAMPRTQANLDAQARFSVMEMKRPRYANKLTHFWRNPNASPESFAKELGRNYIVWAYGQNTIKGRGGGRVPFNWGAHDSRRRGYLNTLNGMLGGSSNYTAPSGEGYQTPPDPRLSMSAPDLLAHYRKGKDKRSDVQLLYELAHNNGLAGREINFLLNQGHALSDIASQLGLKVPDLQTQSQPKLDIPDLGASYEDYIASITQDGDSAPEASLPDLGDSYEDYIASLNKDDDTPEPDFPDLGESYEDFINNISADAPQPMAGDQWQVQNSKLEDLSEINAGLVNPTPKSLLPQQN